MGAYLQLTVTADGITLAVKVVPGASRDKIGGVYAGGIKVTVSKPPQDGATNKAMIRLLAQKLGISASGIRIVRGPTKPRKEVSIQGIGVETIRQRLLSAGR
jgi:uncharacterized protein